MAKPARLPSVRPEQTYFITSSTWQKRSLFQSEPLARLFLETLFDYRKQGKYLLHAFVLMPNHFHLLITPQSEVTLERAMQLIKGGFSYRVKAEAKSSLEVWQRGFTDRRVRNREEYEGFVDYIHCNPVEAGLAARPEDYPYCSAHDGFEMDQPPAYLSG